MKKMIPIFLSVVLLLALTACGGSGTEEKSTSAGSVTSRTETEQENGNPSEQTETADVTESVQETSSLAEADISSWIDSLP